MGRRLATLTVEQDKRYGQLFEITVGRGMTQKQADREAWRGLCEEWRELKTCNGAKA